MAEKKAPARSGKKPAAAADATDESLIPDAPLPEIDTGKPADIDDAVIVAEEPAVQDPATLADPDSPPTPAADDAVAKGQPDTDAPQTDIAEPAEPDRPEPPREKVVERVIEHRGSAIPMVLAGLVVAAAGFAAGQAGLLPDNSPPPPPDLSADVAALTDRLSGIESDLAGLPSQTAAPDLSPIDARLGAIESALADLSDQRAGIEDRLSALDTRITELAARPITDGASEAAVAAFEAELAGLQSAIAAQRAEVEQMVAAAQATEAQAAEQARRAEAQAAIGRLVAALDRGDALQAELAALSALGVTIPDALTQAGDGVAPLSALQADFPDAARAALAAARTADSSDTGVTGWLQKQLGARSVTPRAGDDPDAVLSRAEAALTQGQVDQALQELQSLPEAAQAPLSDWQAAAVLRRDAVQAIDALAAELTSN